MTTQNPDISLEICGDAQEIAVIRLTRPAKRNALNDGLILALRNLLDGLPGTVRAAVIDGQGPHCDGGAGHRAEMHADRPCRAHPR